MIKWRDHEAQGVINGQKFKYETWKYCSPVNKPETSVQCGEIGKHSFVTHDSFGENNILAHVYNAYSKKKSKLTNIIQMFSYLYFHKCVGNFFEAQFPRQYCF